jgi:NADPH2:quinone reductase
MRAVVCRGAGGPEVLAVARVPDPEPGPQELLVRVRAAALNRADVMQRAGSYSPPPGVSPILGVEIAGEVVALGSEVTGHSLGERVCGIVGGGGYAELCPLDAEMALAVPEGWSFATAAAMPEVFFTADTTLFELGRLAAGQSVLVHAGGSGVGTACVQLAKAAGARAVVTAGSAEKIARAVELGAAAGWNYKEVDFVAAVLDWSGGEGVDVVEDFIGGPYLARNLAVLKPDGRLILVGDLGGEVAELDVLPVILRRLQILGSSMRPLPLAGKRAIARRFRERWLPALLAGDLRPIVDRVFPFEDAAAAHAYMEADRNFGKILLELG